MEKMLVTTALKELKLLDARINRTITDFTPVVGTKKSEKNAKPGVSKEEFVKESRAKLQSIEDLIKRREVIKAAIVQSNAETMVEICGEQITVAKAIDLKNSINYKIGLLLKLEESYSKELAKINKENAKMENAIENLVETSYGRDNKDKVRTEDYESIAKPYREHNEYDLLDPIDIKKQIEDLHNYIDEFNATVDSKLQISNCCTYIEF